MRPPQSISVHVPTYRAGPLLGRLLDALALQRPDVPWDLFVVDSGSEDGTWELLERRAADFPVPVELRRIRPDEFDHGDTRNLLASLSRGELLVFLTQDAIPASPDWLGALAADFADPAVGAAYSRNVPRPDADLLTRVFSENDPGYAPERREVRLPDAVAYAALDPHERRLLYNFNDVASAVRRELWERHPFPRTDFGEDLLMARALLEAGHTVVYDERATVEHSHDWSAEELAERARIDGRFNAEWLGRNCVASRADAETLTRRQLARDREALGAAGLAGDELERELERAAELRRAVFVGLWEGGRTSARRPRTRVLERGDLHVLYVVHGFPPDTWAGTEVYTLGLAREVQRLGHRCTVLARGPADAPGTRDGPSGYTLSREDFEGITVLRAAHAIADQPIGESYRHPLAEDLFRQVLARERPDVVHFQHLLHFSADLPRIAREQGLPTVVTCNDYWALCARVQLIRPDGVRCEENQGLGCLWCVKEKDPAAIPRARGLASALAPVAAVGRVLARLPRFPSVKVERTLFAPRRKLERWVRSHDELMARQDFVLAGYAAADLQIAPSRFLRDKHLATGSFEPRRFVYSDYGMRTDHLQGLERRPDPDGRVRLGYVGSLVWYKGVDVLLRAMSRLRDAAVVLRVFGDYRPREDAYHADLERLAEGSAVEFHGRFDNEQLADVHAEIDALVVPSVWFENSPITIHEAFLTRTPLVVSDIGGMAELVRDGLDGLHFRAGDEQDLARRLRDLVDDRERLSALGADPPRVKTLEENAREMEFRYRALACIQRPRPNAGA